jgi:carotenoid cleavage dioxygenase-like enzyme
MVHDFAVTARHVMFPVLPLTGDMSRARAGGPAFAWEPARGGFLGVLQRDKGVTSLTWSEIEPRYVFHVMNAFDEGQDVVMDLVEYDTVLSASVPMYSRPSFPAV